MKLRISHITRYEYDFPLEGESFMEVRLRPLTLPGIQICRDFKMTVDPATPVFHYTQPDEMGAVYHFVIREGHTDHLLVSTESVVDVLQENPFAKIDLLDNDWPLLRAPDFRERYVEWLAPSVMVPASPEWNPGITAESVFAYGSALAKAIHEEFSYVPGTTDVLTPLNVFIAQRRGVCQDYAHLMLAVARSAGVPARYVSGYIYSGNDDDVVGGDAMHAWVELLLPHSREWLGFDPTNNIVVSDHHVKVAVGRDYSDVPPTKGLMRAAFNSQMPNTTSLVVTVSVRQIPED